jgi:hypothetical protein
MKRKAGYIIAACGLLLLIINALVVVGGAPQNSTLLIMGVLLAVIGVGYVRKARQEGT